MRASRTYASWRRSCGIERTFAIVGGQARVEKISHCRSVDIPWRIGRQIPSSPHPHFVYALAGEPLRKAVIDVDAGAKIRCPVDAPDD